MTPKIKQIDDRLAVLYTLRDGFNDCIVALQEQRRNLVSEAVAPTPEVITPESFMAFRNWGAINTDTYNHLHKWFNERYGEFGEKLGVRARGAFPNGQVGLEVCFDQNRPFEEQRGLLELWPYVEPYSDPRFPNEPPKIFVGIFEYTLSQHASINIEATPDKKRIAVTSGRYSELAWNEDGDLEKILKYVYRRHPYRLKKGSKRCDE